MFAGSDAELDAMRQQVLNYTKVEEELCRRLDTQMKDIKRLCVMQGSKEAEIEAMK